MMLFSVTQAVCIHLTNLEVLKLSWSVSITDKGLLGLTPDRSHLLQTEAITDDQKLGKCYTKYLICG